MNYKSKKNKLSRYLCLFSVLLIPVLAQAENYETGDIASKRAAEQRAALAKKAEKRKQEAEAKKQAEAQKVSAAQKAPEAPKEK